MKLPPPHKTRQIEPYRYELPDYYLGCLIYYDGDGDDNCRWVVYDGRNYVRCATRRDATDYINKLTDRSEGETRRQLISARIDVNSAIEKMEAAAVMSEPARRLLLQRHAVRLRPVLVDLDNIIMTCKE